VGRSIGSLVDGERGEIGAHGPVLRAKAVSGARFQV
jgi:hypothetical protein